MRNIIRKLAVCFLAWILVCTTVVTGHGMHTAKAAQTFKIHFIDVGCADAALLQYGEGTEAKYALIDTGANQYHNTKDTTIDTTKTPVYEYLNKMGVKHLEFILLTHPHQDHTVNILGWIQYEKVKWLQNNNPEVPGLVYKLTPTEEKVRKLKKVRDLWQDIMEVQEIRDVFTGQPVKKKKYDIDHFIPWSFVMNDELWNLMPMDASLNSSKSNRLPKWNPFFQNFAQNQYLMYQMIYDDMGIYKRFKGCYKDNLHSIWAGQELYRKGNSKEMFYNILEKNMIPVYDSARRQGYEIWDYS